MQQQLQETLEAQVEKKVEELMRTQLGDFTGARLGSRATHSGGGCVDVIVADIRVPQVQEPSAHIQSPADAAWRDLRAQSARVQTARCVD